MLIEPAAMLVLLWLLGLMMGILGTLAYQHKPNTLGEYQIIPAGSYIYKDGKISMVEEVATYV